MHPLLSAYLLKILITVLYGGQQMAHVTLLTDINLVFYVITIKYSAEYWWQMKGRHTVFISYYI